MNERVREEIELLKKQFPELQRGGQLDWGSIPELVLPPERFNKSSTKVLFRIPVGYPATGPDNFFVDADLRLKNGSPPPAFNAGDSRAVALHQLKEVGVGFLGIPKLGVQQQQSKVAITFWDSCAQLTFVYAGRNQHE